MKIMKLLPTFILIMLTLCLHTEAAKLVNPTGGELIDHGAKHRGVDIYSKPKQLFLTPVDCTILRIEKDPLSAWSGVLLQGEDKYSQYKFRLLGIDPTVAVGEKLSRGTVLGKTQNPKKKFADIKPYIHFEVYENDISINPTELAKKLFPDRSIINAGSDSDFLFRHTKLVDKAQSLKASGDINGAIRMYKKSLDYPSWEIIDTSVLHDLADSYAKIGAYEEALEIQERLLKLLSMKLEYAMGKVPDQQLGIIAAVNNVQSLNILIHAQRSNRDAYKLNEQTRIFY